MIIIDLMIVVLLVYSVTLLSRVKIMFNYKYTQIITAIFAMYTPISKLIEGYKLGYIDANRLIIINVAILLFILCYIIKEINTYIPYIMLKKKM